jgi:Chlorophyll A-B binding protein
MMKSLLLVVVVVASTATAFAPPAATMTSTSTSSTTRLAATGTSKPRLWNSMVEKSERSKSVPFLPRAKALDGTMVGDVGFDPFYLSSIPKNFAGFLQPPSWENQQGIPTLYWMREAELKHSRVAMLAVAGWIATDLGARFPFALYQNIPNSYSAHNTLVEQGTMAVLLLAVGLIEISSGAALVQVSKGESDRAAGDFGLDPPGLLKGKSIEYVNNMKLKELNNGRIAMLAFGGIATQTALGSVAFPYF